MAPTTHIHPQSHPQSHPLLHPEARGLIFDMDGTVIDSLEINWQAMDRALRRHDIVIEREEFIGMTGQSLEKIASLLAAKFGKSQEVADDIVRHKREYANSQADSVKPIDYVADVARQNFGRLPMAIGTGSDRNRADMMLRAAGLAEYFPIIVAAEDVENHKPEPDTFLRCAEMMGVDPAHCQVFEDADLGLEAARRAGMIATDVRPYI